MDTRKKSQLPWLLLAIGVTILVGAWFLYGALSRYEGEKTVWIYVQPNSSVLQMRDSINVALGKGLGGRVAKLVSNDVAEAGGAFEVHPGDRSYQIARRLNGNHQTPVRLVINNVRTPQKFADVVARQTAWSPFKMREALDFAADRDSISAEEAFARIIPDTYEIYWNAEPIKIINKLHKSATSFWTAERCRQAEALKLTPFQTVVLASIVEEESKDKAEWGKIGRLYLNRIATKMPLQADPTIKYATGDFAARRITVQMLKEQSPYNTYMFAGLPPGPIRLPSKAVVDSVLAAPSNNFLYMCASPDFSGSHRFASDFATHARNAAAYRRALDARGIKN